MELLLIFISATLINNFVLAYFTGICPFIGVSNKLSSAFPMGLATTFVLVLTAIASWLIYFLILVPYHVSICSTWRLFSSSPRWCNSWKW